MNNSNIGTNNKSNNNYITRHYTYLIWRLIHHIESINQENQQIILQNEFKTYDNGRHAHTYFRNPSGYKVHSLYIRNTVFSA